eukprot:118472-Alexandrium_andersonii.AAC.1
MDSIVIASGVEPVDHDCITEFQTMLRADEIVYLTRGSGMIVWHVSTNDAVVAESVEETAAESIKLHT